MKYFSNIKSLDDLKYQYRKLALAHHPDKGGTTEAMQEINNEYEVLFPIWKDRVKDISNDTAQSTRSEFYTEYGWKGENYNGNLRMKEITKIIRNYAKEKYPTYKFSVRTPDVYSIDISLMEAPQDVFNPDQLSEYERGRSYIQLNKYHLKDDKRLTGLAGEILNDVKSFAESYNFDDSDIMTDYFHVNFYLHITVGQWDKPFKVVEKTARIKAEKPKENTAGQKDLTLTIEQYSEKAFVVRGDTYQVKERLSEIGGRYNKFLKDGAGYIFSNKKRTEVEKFIEQWKNQIINISKSDQNENN